MIGRKDTHHSVGVLLEQEADGERDGGRGVALNRFGYDLPARNFGQLFQDLSSKGLTCQHPHALGCDQRLQTFEGLFE